MRPIYGPLTMSLRALPATGKTRRATHGPRHERCRVVLIPNKRRARRAYFRGRRHQGIGPGSIPRWRRRNLNPPNCCAFRKRWPTYVRCLGRIPWVDATLVGATTVPSPYNVGPEAKAGLPCERIIQPASRRAATSGWGSQSPEFSVLLTEFSVRQKKF